MNIVKSTGEVTEFDVNKIRATLRRAGAKPELVEKVIENVNRKATDGMTTRQIHQLIRRELRKLSRSLANRYNLRDALLKLGPAGFKFEKYVASILTAYQYEVELPEDDIPGLCVRHEIDCIARRDGKTAMIEAKFRNRFGETVNLKDVMSTWSCFLDLVDGAAQGKGQRFDEVWVVTNGRFSERSLQFGVCRGMHLVGWGAEEHSLARLVDHATLYPITAISDIKASEMDGFAANNLMLCRQIAGRDTEELAKTVGLPPERTKKIIAECREVVQLD